MSSCPDPSNKVNCAFEAARDLVDSEMVLVDYTSALLGKPGFIIDRRASGALEVLTLQRVHAEDLLTEIADLGCVTCERCVQIVDMDGEVSVRFAQLNDSPRSGTL